MAKRSDTLETVLLAVELLRRIPRGRKVTASELHRHLRGQEPCQPQLRRNALILTL